MENTANTQQKQYKRVNRAVPQPVRDRISASLKGKPKSPEHRAAISKSLRADTGGYWSHIPPAPEKEEDNGWGDIIL